MVSKQQNRSIPVPQPAWKLKLLIVAILFFLLTGGKVFGASPFTDNFDSYNTGNLVPQGSWATSTTSLIPQVSTSTASSNPNSIWWTSENYGSIKEGSHEVTGHWSFWAKVNSDAGFNGEITAVSLTGTDYSNTASALIFSCVSNDCETTELAKVEICGVELCQIPIDEWTKFQVEWDSSTNEAKWKCGSNDWSDFEQCYTNTFNYVQGFYVQGGNQTGLLKTNLDSISSTCSIDDCGLCEVYPTCVNAGCSWYYSVYLQDYYCVDPIVPDPDECGSFYKCQYCGTQTTCEAELNCQWEDRGFDEQCYMEEPTIPPEQVDWEIPDLDDCSSLPALDTLVCEIKNLLTGAVMPTQEKVEELYQTIGAFKEKFPFNYIESFNIFFSEIAESLDEEKEIPIEILGATSSVNFVFWNATTTIGGEVETFKNILFDFTTFIILAGWFVWFISLIRRFF